MAIDPGTLLSQAMSHALAYRRTLAEDPRPPSADYHAMLERFTEAMPEQGTAAGEVIEALATQAMPGLMPMAGPRFFGWVIGASHPAGVAADWLVSAWGQNTGYHSPTPATAAIEAVAERWLLERARPATGQLHRLLDRRHGGQRHRPGRGAHRRAARSRLGPRRRRPLRRAAGRGADRRRRALVGVLFAAAHRLRLPAGDEGRHRRRRPHAAAGAGARAGRQARPEDRHRASGADQHRRLRSVHRDRGARQGRRSLGARGRRLRAVGPGRAGAAPPDRGHRRCGLLGDRRAQVAAGALRLRLRHRQGSHDPPTRDDAVVELPADHRRGRPGAFGLRARTLAPGPRRAGVRDAQDPGTPGRGRAGGAPLRAGAAVRGSCWPGSQGCGC